MKSSMTTVNGTQAAAYQGRNKDSEENEVEADCFGQNKVSHKGS